MEVLQARFNISHPRFALSVLTVCERGEESHTICKPRLSEETAHNQLITPTFPGLRIETDDNNEADNNNQKEETMRIEGRNHEKRSASCWRE
jgi:hypothetical protein